MRNVSIFLPLLREPVLLITRTPWEIIVRSDVTANVPVENNVISFCNRHGTNYSTAILGGQRTGRRKKKKLAACMDDKQQVICMHPGPSKWMVIGKPYRQAPRRLTLLDSANVFNSIMLGNMIMM